jgi:hypothetical protein
MVLYSSSLANLAIQNSLKMTSHPLETFDTLENISARELEGRQGTNAVYHGAVSFGVVALSRGYKP